MRLFSTKKPKEPIRQPHIMSGQDEYTFRRSRTLTGTTSTKVTPSAEARSTFKTPRLKEHELRQQRTHIGRMLLIIVGCLLFLGWIIANYISGFTVSYTQQSKVSTKPHTSAYQETLRTYFSTYPFERFGFSINTRQVEQFLKQAHSEIETIAITRSWYGGDVQFAFSFRQPILVWQVGTKQFYVDDQGIAFTYDHFGGQYVSVTDQSGISPDTSKSIASQRFIQFLGKMVGAVNDGNKGRVVAVIIPPSTREIHLKLEGRDYPIKTHIDRDPLQQAEDIINSLKYFDANKIKPVYIDVRVGGKAFYK